MRRFIVSWLLLLLVCIPVSAVELEAPEVPPSGQAFFPAEPESFSKGLWEMIENTISVLQPTFAKTSAVCVKVLCVCILSGILLNLPGKNLKVIEIASTSAIALLLLEQSGTFVQLAAQTVTELSEYGKMLLPVLTSALASQGAAASSAALYSGTVVFNAVLSNVISAWIVPMIYMFLCLGIAHSAIGEDMLGKLQGFIKWVITWSLKIVLYVFIGYIGITGVISGNADAAAIKAAKITISGVVPVVGGILSDASEAILVGAGIVKNSIGIYGMLAVLSVCIGPFFQIGAQYLMLKMTAAVSGVVAGKHACRTIGCFSTALGLLLGMTGSVCLLLLISTAAFLKGVG